MSLLENPDNLKLLQQLLSPKDADSSDSKDENVLPARRVQQLGPADISPPKPTVAPPKPSNAPATAKSPDEQIDKWLERQEKEDNEILEQRTCPEYTISYKQAVGTADMFLQMNNKTPSTFSCENMVIVVQLPEEQASSEDMDLSVTEKEIDLQTPMYRLKLPLAHTIDPDKGGAKFDPVKKTMQLTLVLKRELDFVNF